MIQTRLRHWQKLLSPAQFVEKALDEEAPALLSIGEAKAGAIRQLFRAIDDESDECGVCARWYQRVPSGGLPAPHSRPGAARTGTVPMVGETRDRLPVMTGTFRCSPAPMVPVR